MKINYIKIPLSCIPFKEIKSLEGFDYECISASYFSLKEINGTDTCLLSVYNTFDNDQTNYDNSNLLFGRVVSETPRLRNPGKVIKVENEEQQIKISTLPYLKYSNTDLPDGNWFYTKEGDYFIFSSIESTYESVKHLESISIYADNIVRLRIVIELLKSNVKKGIVNLSLSDFGDIAFKVLKSDFNSKGISDEEFLAGVENWLPSMLNTPLFEDIPNEIRERPVVL